MPVKILPVNILPVNILPVNILPVNILPPSVRWGSKEPGIQMQGMCYSTGVTLQRQSLRTLEEAVLDFLSGVRIHGRSD